MSNNHIEFVLTTEQRQWVENTSAAIGAYNEALKKEFLNGSVDFSVKNSADLFFTESFFEELSRGEAWRISAESCRKELREMAATAASHPEQFARLFAELEAIAACFDVHNMPESVKGLLA